MLTDLRLALRSLAKTRGFTAVCILTLALGIGSTTAMFCALRALVFDPAPWPESARLVQAWSNQGQPFSAADFSDMHAQASSFESFGVYAPRTFNFGGDQPEAVVGVMASPGVLRAFGVQPMLGRWIDDADDVPGAPAVVVISHAFWQRSLSGDPSVIGRTIRFNGDQATVIGVMPPEFEFFSPWLRTQTCHLWTALRVDYAKGDRGSHWMCAVARLKPGVTVAAADAEVKMIGLRLKEAHPDTNTHKPFLLRSIHDEMTRGMGRRTWMLFGAVVLVLVIACANVAGMLLARSARRQGEYGLRLALGASFREITRVALAESFVLAAAGTLAGLFVAYGGVRILQLITPATEARRAAIALDPGVLAFAAALTLLATLLAGVPPALAASRTAVAGMLRETGGRGSSGSRTRQRFQRGLIIAQVALAFVLANGAALFSASYMKLLDENSALSTEYVLTAEINLRGERYKDRAARGRFWDQLAERCATIPGVSAAGTTTKLPLEGGSNTDILVNDQTFDPTQQRLLTEVSAITPGYFEAAGIAILRGRTLTQEDSGEKNIGVVINRTLAEKCWPGEDPLGKLIRPNDSDPDYIATVVGLAEDVRQWGPEEPPRPEMYWLPDRAWGEAASIVLRSPQPASTLLPALRRELAALDADLPISDVRTLAQVVTQATRGQRVIAGMINTFMAIALGLVAVGLYGTLSYHVLQRTREIGVRVAMGALRGDIARLVLVQGARWVVVGVVIGVGAALGATALLKGMIYGVSTVSPWLLAAASLVVAFTAALACLLPALRAARIDPNQALRAD
ncbi:MAG: ABC transporter permease [Opitutaceae bacterium]|nr:ABC transporter permease [Opitutaceae bacterium]